MESNPEFIIASPIDFEDEDVELVPEAYIESKPVQTSEIQTSMEKMVRDTVAYLIKSGKEGDIQIEAN